MKQILSILVFALCVTINAQDLVINQSVSLSVDSHLVNNPSTQYVEPHQNGCNILSGNVTINGDLNLNGNILYVKQGTNLTITGYFNGSGEIRMCNNGNNTSSVSICATNTQNNPNLNGISCDSSLSTPIFDIQKDLGLYYTLYVLETGQKIKEGVTTADMFYDVPKNVNMVLKVEGFEHERIRIQ